MKKIIILFLVLIFNAICSASQLLPGGDRAVIFEDESRRNTLDSSLFFGLSAKGVECKDKIGAELGLSLGTMINSYSSIGITVNYLLSHNIRIGKQGESLTLFHGGVVPEIYLPLIVPGLYANAACQLGFGYADYTQITTFAVQKATLGRWLLIAEPSIALYQRVSNDILIGLRAGKRFSSNFRLIELERKDFQGRFVTLSFRVLMFTD